VTAPILQWYDGADLIVAPEDLAAATPGTASTEGSFDLWNDKDGDGADTAYDRVLELKARVPLTAAEIVLGTPARPFVSVGHEVVDDYWFEARIASGLGDLTVSTGPWTPLGAGRWLKIPTLASEQGVTVDLRLNTPSGAQSTSVEWALSITRQTSRPLPIGLHESVGPGIALGIGDSEMTQLLSISANVAENGGGVDAQVQMPDIIGVAAGVPYTILEHLTTITNADSAAATLIAGERYKSLIYISSEGVEAQAKSVKTSGTPDDPVLPEGGLAIAMVTREFDALVNDADITNTYLVGAAHFISTGLTGSIGPYRAVLDNRLIETSTASSFGLTDASTNRIWLLPDGSLSVTTTAALPESRAMLLWEATTVASAVTVATDRRLFLGHGFRFQRLDFIFDTTLAGTQKQRAAFASNRPGYILPLGGVSMYLLTNGDTSGGTTIDVNLRAPGGAFTTIYTSQGSEDRRPFIAHDSTNLEDTDSRPEVLAVPANSLLEVEIDTIPGGSTPVWLHVVILVAVP